MLPTHTIICSSNPQRPRDGRRRGGKMLWFVKTQTTEEKVESTIDLTALAGGVYTYNCFVGNEKKKTGKLLKY